MIGILDYGLGNLMSILRMLEKLEAPARLVADVKEIDSCSKIILPGVGHFKTGMQLLQEKGFAQSIHRFQQTGRWVLGICLGMQMLTQFSEEGFCDGLGLVAAKTLHLKGIPGLLLRVPHVGFDIVRFSDSPLTRGLASPAKFYFTHSYYVTCEDPGDMIGETEYGTRFASVFQRKNVIGCQFHPEKSHQFGLQFLKRFAELNECF